MLQIVDSSLIIDTLRILKRAGEFSFPTDTLFTSVNGSRIDPVGLNTFKDHLIHAEEKGWISFKVDKIDGRKRWYITDAGEALLR